MIKVYAYTDGACSGNPGPGGWGVALTAKVGRRHISGYSPDTTNNRMELQAAIEVFKALKTACDVTIYSDSQYLIHTMTKGWARRANRDLWQELDRIIQPHKVEWIWVKGHADVAGNVTVDTLATNAIKYRKGIDRRFK